MITYIRHYFDGRKKETADTTAVFSPLADGEPYQDVIRLTCMDDEASLLYTVGKSVFPQKFELSKAPQRWTIFYVAEGVLFFGKEQLGKGDFMIVPSSFTHNLSTKKEKNRFYWFATNDEWLIHVFSIGGYSKNEVMRGYTDYEQAVTDILEKTIYRFPEECDPRIYMMSRFTCLLSYLSTYSAKTQKISEQLLLRCISHIETSYGALNVDDLAKRFFVTRRYLYAIFKEYKKVSPIEYIISVRMKAADKFLLTTDFSIAKIAELTGYSSYNQFTRAYKEYYSIQPSKRRELLKTHDLETKKEE